MRITREGQAFLAYIGDEADDPDVLLRWRSGDLFGMAGDIPAMDRWLNRSFRSIKRKVSGFPASPVTEVVKTPWPTAATNQFLVWGHRIDFDQSMLLEDKVASLIADFDAHESETELAKRRYGVVRQNVGFGELPAVVGIWVGVPVAVTTQGSQELPEIDLFKDWSQFDQMYFDTLARLPAWVDDGQAPNLILAEKTALSPIQINVPPKLNDVTRVSPVSKVFAGHVLALDNLDLCEPELRRHAGNQSLARVFSNITDGVRSFGYGKSLTIVYGMLVGYRDAVSGNVIVQRRVSDLRLEKMDDLFRRARKENRLVFGHQDMSEYGFWLVSPSGVVTAVDPDNDPDGRIVYV